MNEILLGNELYTETDIYLLFLASFLAGFALGIAMNFIINRKLK